MVTDSTALPGRQTYRLAQTWRTWVPKAVPFTALVLLIIAFSGTANFFTARNLNSILLSLAPLLLVSVGATIPILIGSIDLSLGAIIDIAGGTGAVLVTKHGEVALVAVPLIGLAAGVLNGLVVAFGRLPSFLVTLGASYVFSGLADLIMHDAPVSYTGSFSHSVGDGQWNLLGLEIPYLAVIALAILIVVTIFATRTRYGRGCYAVGGAERVAGLAGLPVRRVKVASFAVAGLLAGLAALALTMSAQAATPTAGDEYLLTSIAAVVIGGTSLSGGVGGPQWTLLGVLVILVLGDGMTLAGINPDVQTVIRGLVIVLASALTIRRLSDIVK